MIRDNTSRGRIIYDKHSRKGGGRGQYERVRPRQET